MSIHLLTHFLRASSKPKFTAVFTENNQCQDVRVRGDSTVQVPPKDKPRPGGDSQNSNGRAGGLTMIGPN